MWNILSKVKRGMSVMEGALSVLALVVVAITASIGGLVLAGIQTGQTANSVAYNATQYGLVGVNNFSSLVPSLGTILIAGLIISVLLAVFVFRKQ